MPGPRGRLISSGGPGGRCGAIWTDRLPTCHRRSTGPPPAGNFAQWGTRRLVASVHEVGSESNKALRIGLSSESRISSLGCEIHRRLPRRSDQPSALSTTIARKLPIRMVQTSSAKTGFAASLRSSQFDCRANSKPHEERCECQHPCSRRRTRCCRPLPPAFPARGAARHLCHALRIFRRGRARQAGGRHQQR